MNDLEPGVVVADRYEVRAVIGRGGTGTVYEAIDRIRGDEVALKILHPELATEPLVVARMMREGELLARLGVGHVTEFGQTRIGRGNDFEQVYIVMPRLSGKPLSALLEAGPIEPTRAVAITRGLCSELARAHAHGIVHRDIKPDNVIVGADGSIQLIDFGVAKRQGSFQGASVTEHGVVFGTPEYMAPEQAQGLRLDARSDLYATGVVLFEMLSGSRPFVGEGETVMRDKSSTTAPYLADAIASPALRRVVADALATDPRDRYRSAVALSWALERASVDPMGDKLVTPARASEALGESPHTQMSVRLERESIHGLVPAAQARVASHRPARVAPREAALPWWGWVVAGCIGSLIGAWLAWR
jgi:serine/threonine-protein kinase